MKKIIFETNWCSGTKYIVTEKENHFQVFQRENVGNISFDKNLDIFIDKFENISDAKKLARLLIKTYECGYSKGSY